MFTLPPKPGYIEINGRYYNAETGEMLRDFSEFTLSEIRQMKLTEVGASCEAAIFAGVEVGGKQYALTLNDQTNIGNLALHAQAGVPVLYHADGELCRWFTAEEILAIMEAATKHKVYHTTLCNHYNVWIRRETDADVLKVISYGCPLPADLADSMAALLGSVGGDS